VTENKDAPPGEAGLTVSPWALRGVIPALGRTRALRGFPGGIDVAGPGWLAEEDQAAHGAWPGDAGGPAAGSVAGPGAGVNGAGSPLPGPAQLPRRGNGARRGAGRGGRGSEPGTGRRQPAGRVPAGGRETGGTMTGDDGRSVWQRALSAWREAGLEWQRPAGWAPADVDLQRTEPIPVVPADDAPLAGPVADQAAGPGDTAGPAAPDQDAEAGPAERVSGTGATPAPEIAAQAPAGGRAAPAGAPDQAGDTAPAADARPAGAEATAAAPGSAARPAARAGEPESADAAPESAGGVPEPGIAEPGVVGTGPEPGAAERGAAGGVPEPGIAEPGVVGTGPEPGAAERGAAGGVPEPGIAALGAAGGVPEPRRSVESGIGALDLDLGPAVTGGGAPGRASDAHPPANGGGPPANGAPGRAAGRDGGPDVAGHPEPGGPSRRAGRGVLVGAGICVVVIVLAIAGIVVTGHGGGGQPAGLIVTSPSAVLADGQFAGPGGIPRPAVPPALTGIAAVGSTVVAVGAQATLPSARPLVLTSADGGQTWQQAVLQVPGGATAGAGAVPLMIAGGQGKWLALGADATWTSADGRSWRLGPAIAPVAAGDRVRALAQTGTGFLAVGENVHLQGTEVVRSPVLWTTSDGLTWQREDAAQLRLPAGKGRVVALRWAAANGSTVLVAGDVTRTAARRQGGRLASVTIQSVVVWRTTNSGLTWARANPPVSNGATTGLAGLAATGSGVVAIRPGHTMGGVPDAVAYVATHGAAWRYAGKLRAHRGGALVVTAVSGSDDGAVVAGSAGAYRVAFVTVHGWSWRQTADLAESQAKTVTGVTVGPHGNVVAAGASAQPFLLLARTRRMLVGQAALAGAAATGVSVNGLGVNQGDQVAVGQDGREPAIWLRPAGGQWAQVTAPAPASWQGEGPGLTTVVHGSAGWLAIGTEGGPGSSAPLGSSGLLTVHAVGGSGQPVMLTSADGRSWQPQAGPGPAAAPTLTLTGAAAGPSGYVVTGMQSRGGRPVPALFWSADLRQWRAQGRWTGYSPAGQPASSLLAVAAGRAGFAAVGAIGNRPAVWLSRTGRDWLMQPLALPRGARGAVLQQVAIQGRRIAALGTQARGSGPAPFAAVSTDGGRTWRESLLPGPAHPATVTSITTAGRGFAATGTVAANGGQDVIVWWSADGQAWQVVRASGNGLSGPGTHAITGLAGLGGVVTGVGYAATPTGQHPILWHARIG
jgi:hypothetical protein